MGTKTKYLIVSTLLLTAIIIWARDLTWMNDFSDTTPVILSLHIAWWLGHPWIKREETLPLPLTLLSCGTILFSLGLVSNSTIVMTTGWTLTLYIIIRCHYKENTYRFSQLAILPLLAFPWITNDLNFIEFWFRLSGAWLSAQIFSFSGFSVQQNGTFLIVEGLPVSVESAC